MTGMKYYRRAPWVRMPSRADEASRDLQLINGSGGLRVKGEGNCSVPFASLSASREWVNLGARSSLLSLTLAVSIHRSEVEAVVGMHGYFASPGIQFLSASQRFDGVIFWTMTRAQDLLRLDLLGWPIVGPAGGVRSSQ